jgi:hypothetical protein
VDDSAWDKRLPCEKPDCTDPECPTRRMRTVYRVALGTMVEAMQRLNVAYTEATDYWGVCTDPDCTYEVRLNDHFNTAGLAVQDAMIALAEAVKMWKALPKDWAEPELDAFKQAILDFSEIKLAGAIQADNRKAGRLGQDDHP